MLDRLILGRSTKLGENREGGGGGGGGGGGVVAHPLVS